MDFFFFTSDYTDKVPPDTLVSKFDSELTLSTILVFGQQYRNREKYVTKGSISFQRRRMRVGFKAPKVST